MKKVIFSLVAVAALSSTAFAGKNVAPAPLPPLPVPEKPAPEVLPPLGLYIGGGFTYAKSECKCDDKNVKFSDGSKGNTHEGKTYGVNLKAGYEFNEYIGIEGKYLYTPWGDKEKTLKHYGLYVKPNMPLTENIDAYALLGYGKTECETLSDSYKGFAWGVGTEYSFGTKKAGAKEGWGVYAEYLRPLKKSGDKNLKVDTVSAGVAYHF
jgi:opacity protein-like surface antigen